MEAFEQYKLTENYEDSSTKIKECADALLDNNDLVNAKQIYTYLNNKDLQNYCDARLAFESGKYADAQKLFESCIAIRDAEEYQKRCILKRANAYMSEGYLNNAKQLYESLPVTFSFDGIAVREQLNKIDSHKDFLDFCGQWKSNDMDASVRQTHDSTGLWDQWDGDGWGYTVDITCVINNDDTVTMRAEAEFWTYTNYSSLSAYLKNADRKEVFTYTGKSVPSSIKIADTTFSGNEISGSLSIAKNNFKLNYQIKDRNSSMNFTYTYKAFGTYDTFVVKH